MQTVLEQPFELRIADFDAPYADADEELSGFQHDARYPQCGQDCVLLYYCAVLEANIDPDIPALEISLLG